MALRLEMGVLLRLARNTSDLQKSRHLQKSRVTELHNRGTKRKLKSHQARKKGASRLFWGGGVRLQLSLCAPIVPLGDETLLQMTRLLEVTSSAN